MSHIREYEIIAGPYHGTYGEVLVGRHSTLGFRKAIKRLHAHVRPEIIREEALKQQAVRSPYVVQIHDFFEEEGQAGAIVMEYCPVGLDQFLKERFVQTNSKIPYDEARELLYGILQGLNDAHNSGIVHGDLKPANVRFGLGKKDDELGLPKLADFGAAIRLREASPALRGSTNWMAPEVINGSPATSESDYFSFGVLAYLTLTGRHPFFANDPSCLYSEEDNIQSLTFRPAHLATIREDLPDRIADLIMELLSREPSSRSVAEKALKATFSQPLQPETRPSQVTPPVSELPTEDEKSEINAAYDSARESFFSLFRPREAVDQLNSFLKKIQWERFVGKRVSYLADCWSLKAFIHNSGGFFDAAVESASNGLKVDESHVNSLHARGYALIQLGRYNEALSDLSRAFEVTTDPTKRKQIRQLLDTLEVRYSLSNQAEGTPMS